MSVALAPCRKTHEVCMLAHVFLALSGGLCAQQADGGRFKQTKLCILFKTQVALLLLPVLMIT